MSSTFDVGKDDTSQNSHTRLSLTDSASEFDSVVSSATLEPVDQHINEEKRFVQNSSRSLNLTSKQADVMPMTPTSEGNTNHCEVLEMPQQVNVPQMVVKYAGIWKAKTAEHHSQNKDDLHDNLARQSVTSRRMLSPILPSTPETAAHESEMADTFHEDCHKNRLTQRCFKKWRAITKLHRGTHTTQHITSKPQSELDSSKHTKRRKSVSEDLDRNKPAKPMYTRTRRGSLPVFSPTSLVSKNPDFLVGAPLVSKSSCSGSEKKCGVPRRKRSISMSSTFDVGNDDTSKNHCEVLETPQQVNDPQMVLKYANIWKAKNCRASQPK